MVFITICMTQFQEQLFAQPARQLSRFTMLKHWLCRYRDQFNGWRMIRNKTYELNVEPGCLDAAGWWSRAIATEVINKVRNRNSQAISESYLATALLHHEYRQEIFDAAADRSNEKAAVDRAMMEMVLQADKDIIATSVLHDAIEREDVETMQLLFNYGIKPENTHITSVKTTVEDIDKDLQALKPMKERFVNTPGYKTLMDKINRKKDDLLRKQRILRMLNALLAA
jgi:hypothetical protein